MSSRYVVTCDACGAEQKVGNISLNQYVLADVTMGNLTVSVALCCDHGMHICKDCAMKAKKSFIEHAS